MKKKLFIISALALACSLCFCSCKKDTVTEETPEYINTAKLDDLAIFQDYLVHLDTAGNFSHRFYGEALDPSDTTHLFVGVDSLAEALELFKTWCGHSSSVTNTGFGDDLVFNPTDADGKAQGVISFNVKDAEDASVAEVTFSQNTAIKHVSKVSFVLLSKWPKNEWYSPYVVGDRSYSMWLPIERKYEQFLCIRSARPGQRGMFVYISDKEFHTLKAPLKHCASWAEASEASKILTANGGWDSFVYMFRTVVSRNLRSDAAYWIDQKKTLFYRAAVELKNKKIGWWATIKQPEKPYIKVVEFDVEYRN